MSWEKYFIDYLSKLESEGGDASHDLHHCRQVYYLAEAISRGEPIALDPLIIMAAAYFHDVIALPKNHPERASSSRLAARKAQEILTELGFPQNKIGPVCHAIEAHSFTAAVTPETGEAKAIQDADRMQALGAVGILRLFYTSGRMGSNLYDPVDLHGQHRPLDDTRFAVDHFYVKLFKLPDLLQTVAGRRIAVERAQFLKSFLSELERDIQWGEGAALALAILSHEAGQEGLKLYDAADPLAVDRLLDPASFFLDRWIEQWGLSSTFCKKFLSQLHKELILTQQSNV